MPLNLKTVRNIESLVSLCITRAISHETSKKKQTFTHFILFVCLLNETSKIYKIFDQFTLFLCLVIEK